MSGNIKTAKKNIFKQKIEELAKTIQKEVPEEIATEIIKELASDVKQLITLSNNINKQKDYKTRKNDITNKNMLTNEITKNLVMLLDEIYTLNIYEKCNLNNDEKIFYDLKTENYLMYYKKIGKNTDKIEYVTEFKKSDNTINKLINEDLKNTLDIFLNFFLKNVNVKDRKIIKDAVVKQLKKNKITEKIRAVRSMYSPYKKEGLIKAGTQHYYNLCTLPHYKKEETKGINEVFEELKNNYKYLYVLLKNLFVTKENIQYVLNFYGYILKTYKKLPFSIVIHGIQGAGKNKFADYFLTKIFNKQNLLTVGNAELSTDFNGFYLNKLFIVYNEVAGDITKNNLINDKIKQIIADEKILINEKNIARFEIDNMFNTLFLSNSDEPVKVEVSDRRFIVFKTNNVQLVEAAEQAGIKDEKYDEKLDKEAEEFVANVLAKLKTMRPTHYKTEQWYKLLLKTNTKLSLFKHFLAKQDFTGLKKMLIIKSENDYITEKEIENFVDKLSKQLMLSSEDFTFLCKIFYGETDDTHIKSIKKHFDETYRFNNKRYKTIFSKNELINITNTLIIDNVEYEIKKGKEKIIFTKKTNSNANSAAENNEHTYNYNKNNEENEKFEALDYKEIEKEIEQLLKDAGVTEDEIE